MAQGRYKVKDFDNFAVEEDVEEDAKEDGLEESLEYEKERSEEVSQSRCCKAGGGPKTREI